MVFYCLRLSNLLVCAPSTVTYRTARWKSTLRKIEKLLIANRGEIACRVIKTSRRLGIRSVAIYSEADENALHVDLADEAYEIGPAAASHSYLRGDKILEVAKLANCQAIHPGYGFLSENVEFAENCRKHDVIFIGPPPSAIRDMGIKSTSKAIMSKAGVPIIEGYHGDDQSVERLRNEAIKIGFPVMIKAVRGGGGKGMRIAITEQEFEEALESAKTESQKSFADSVVLLEKFIGEPRHVEVQVFADMHGNAVHLFERDCSVQRRHQKIIEEAPAPGLSNELRLELGAAAVKAAKAVGYVGAGTVEFILDKNSHSFHFMEMNTRLQVEHPITEMITGTDLVEWQIKIASGEKLPFDQEHIFCKGHAFEARVYAEDARGGFLPGAGPLLHLTTPLASVDTRIETGVRQGDEVSVHYDPMIAKLVVWGNDRPEALSKLQARLLEYNMNKCIVLFNAEEDPKASRQLLEITSSAKALGPKRSIMIAGLETNINFLLDLSRHPEFAAGNVHTNFIRDHYASLFKDNSPSEVQLIQAALSMVLKDRMDEVNDAIASGDQYNPFIVEPAFRVNYDHQRDVKLKFNNEDVAVVVKFLNGENFSVSCDGGTSWKVVSGRIVAEGDKTTLHCQIDGVLYKCSIFKNGDILAIFNENGKQEFCIPQPGFLTQEEDEGFVGVQNKAAAPMPGVIDKLFVKMGDEVRKGDSLFVLIAMKMEHVVKANRDAKISNVLFQAGDNVAKDATVIQFDVKD